VNIPAIQTLHLTKRYGSLTAVDDLCLEVYPGEVFGFLGPNGAGKTTSIHMMCGLLKPDAGCVQVNGLPVTDRAADVRSRVGICPQDTVLWEHLTCLEQLRFIGEMYGLSANLACSRGKRLLKDLNLDEKCDTQVQALSGGMRRRLNLLMALVHDPEIVVLDEPEAGLDPQGRVLVREYIHSLARPAPDVSRKTVILTTQNMDEADRVADRIAIIDHGRLLVVDTPSALKHSLGAEEVLEIILVKVTDNYTYTKTDTPMHLSTDLCTGLHEVNEITLGQALEDLPVQWSLEPASPLYDGTERLVVRATKALELLPAIIERLTSKGFQPGEAHLRASTLEDVFIRLTGRRLRE
jgi:ABC-2 type transport system ATP-binding protein